MSDKKTVIALGYFDSVHLGHRAVLGEARALADSLNASLVVFTFDGNLKAAVGDEKDTYVYDKFEREGLYKKLGADEIYFAKVDYNFLSTGRLAFLNKLNKKYDIAAYVCGKDYRFGKFGEGGLEDLKKYAEKNSQIVRVIDTVEKRGVKVSTTAVKRLLASGNLREANELLGESYFMFGVVAHGRAVGASLGFPTVNVELANGRQRIKKGVYAGRVSVGGKEYKAMINYGARPTFGLSKDVVEAHIIDFSGDVYGEKIVLYFDGYLRDIKSFGDGNGLKAQLDKDLLDVKNGNY